MLELSNLIFTKIKYHSPSNHNFDKNQNTANFKKIRSQRFKAQDPKPKVQYQRCKAKDPKPKISSQGSHAKDPTPKNPVSP
jgi:hypothetical protein